MRANYKMQRLFVDTPLQCGGLIELDKKQTNYLANVLRMKSGDAILVFNGKDGEWRATVEQPSKKSLALQIETQERPQPEPSELMFVFAPLKIGRLDYMVQKAVEMGAGSLQPVLTAYTQNHKLNMEKMNAYCVEAAEQCGILCIPTCQTPVKFDTLLDDWDDERKLVFCDEDADTNNPVEKLEALKGHPLAVLVGPEGGFSDDERAQLRAKSFVSSIPLGPRILRADTAAVAALSVVQAIAGDW